MSQISDASPEPKPSPEKPVANPADGKAPEAGKSKKSKKPKKPVRWRRRLIIAGVLVLAIGFLIRIAVALLLPTTLRQVAKSYGLDITYERSDMYLFNGDVGLWHVRVTPAGGGEPILQAEYCRGDVSPLQLLRGRLVAERIEADGVELVVRRNADGTIPLLQTLLAGQKPQATPAGSATKAPPQAVDLTPPVAIDALRLTHVRAHLNDRSVSPALQTDVDLNIGLWDLASPVRPTRFTMDVFADALLDSFQVEGQGTSDGKVLDATFRASARGLHPAPLAGYLAPLGLRPRAGEIAMRMNGSIKTTVATGNPNAIQAVLKVENVAVTADGQDALTLKSLTVKADSIAPESIALAEIVVEDGACNAQRTESGAVRLAGIEWSPNSAQATRAAPPPAPAPAAAASTPTAVTPAAAVTPPFRWTLGELAFRKLQATLADRSVSPATNLAFIVDDVSLKGFVCDPDKPDAPVAINGRFLAPGLLREVNLSGTAHPFATNMTADLILKAQGVRPDAVRPYFAAMGFESTLNDGNFSCRLSAGLAAPGPGRLAINARLQQLLWEDGRQLLTLDDVKIAGVGLDGQAGSVRVDAIDVSGPKLSVRRESSGAIAAGGLRFLPRDKSKSAAANSSPKSPVVVKVAGRKTLAEPDLLRSLPKIDIGRFTWNAVRIQFDDDSVSPPTVVAIDDAGIAMENLHIDFDPKAAAPAPGHIRAWLKAPGVAGTLSLDGVVTPRPGGLLADLEVGGEKLSAILTGPYLKSLGVEPTLADATLHARTHIDIAQDGEVLKASIALRDFTLTDGGEELLGLESAAIAGITLKPGVLEVADVELVHPRGRLARDEDYALRVAGFRLLPKPPEQKKSAFAAASGMGPTKMPAASDANVNGGLASQTAAPPMALVLRKLTIRDAAVGWTDRAVLPIAQTSATVNGSVKGVTWGKPAGPAKLSFTAKVNGIADTLSVSGTAAVGADSADVALDLSASGIRQGALASYLPPGMQIELKDGRFAGHLAVSVVPNAMGGMGGKVTFSGIDFRDGADGAPLFRLAEARVALTRLDMPGAIAVDEISTTGAEMSAHKTPGGALHALGIVMAASPPESKATAPTVAPAVARAGPSRPTVLPAMVAPRALAVTPGAAAPATGSSLTLVVAKLKYPLVTVRKLDLNLSRFSFTDESRPGSAPLEVTDLRLFARKPIEMLGDDPASLAPAELELDCRVDHVIDSIRLTMQVAPFAGQPSLQMDIVGAGVHGDGLLALLPELKPQIDGHGLTDGRFRAHLETQLQIDRIDPLDFGLVRGFDADFVMKGLEYRSEENGPVLAGLEEVRSEGIRVKPATGNIVVKSLEVTKPIGVAVREKDGVHVAGLVFKVPEANQPAATQPANVKSSAPTGQMAGATGNTHLAGNNQTPPPLPLSDTGEIRIGKLLVSGIDVRVEDRTVSPPLVVPITQLDLDVRDLSSRALVEDRPVRFSLLVGSGKVSLPRRREHTGVAGALKDAGALLGGKKIDTTPVMEQRELFSQLQADGVLSFYPHPKGWVKTTVSGFDMASLKWEARQFGVDLNEGTFDSSVEARLPGDGSMNTSSHFTFTDLELSEGPNGPIFRYLHLATPLDVVLGVMRDASGSIDVPIAVPIEKSHLSPTHVTGAAIGAFNAITVKAIASAPVKAANTAGEVVNALNPFAKFFGAKPSDNGPFVLEFAAGDDALSPASQATLAAVLRRMREAKDIDVTLTQGLGMGDVTRAQYRANPSPEDALALAHRLEARKVELQRARADLAGRARSELASRPPAEAAGAVERLRAVERDLASTEDSLDRMYELLRPGADRLAGRRTRQAALDVALSRLSAVRTALVASGVPDMATRVQVSKAAFNPADTLDGGRVIVTITKKKKE